MIAQLALRTPDRDRRADHEQALHFDAGDPDPLTRYRATLELIATRGVDDPATAAVVALTGLRARETR